MKRAIVKMAMLTAVLTTCVAQADIVVNWVGESGFSRNDGVSPIAPAGQTALVQLIYSVDNIADNVVQPGGTIVGGNDTVLQEGIVDNSTDGGFGYGFGFSSTYSGPFQAGFVYMRVFDTGTSVGTAAAGTWYYSGPLFATVNNPGGATPPDSINGGAAGSGPGVLGTYALTTAQVVPEPTAIAFLGIGAALVAARRMRKA